MSTWSHAQTLFAEAMPGYQDRPEQSRMAEHIEQSLADNERTVVQAGCGTGKSFGALVPAIDWALRTGEPALVATATKALQTQYSTKDLPFLAELYAQDGRPFTWAVVKGRQAYVCRAKLAEATDVTNLDGLREELDSSEHSGDLDDLLTPLDLNQDRAKITTNSDECPGKDDCPFGDVCYAEMAKAKAAESQVVVANHSFAVVDAQIRARNGMGLLPDYGAIVVDEAHELENYATNGLGKEFTQRGLTKLGADVARHIDDPTDPDVVHYQGVVQRMFTQVLPRILGRNRSASLTDKIIVANGDDFVELIQSISSLRQRAHADKIHGDDRKAQERKRLRKRIDNLTSAIEAVITAESEQLIRWVEVETFRGEDSIKLRYAPLHVGDFLQRTVWNCPERYDDYGVLVEPSRPRAVVLMSATMNTGGGDFSFVARALGLDEGTYTGFDAGTPFDFEKQARIYIPKPRTDANPKGFADPSKDTALWRSQAQRVIRELVLASGGRALLLYTSRKAMLEDAEALEEHFDEAGLTMYVQGQGNLTNRALADRFRAEETSVLFALKSFMTGADFQGRTCQLVIVDKLPFAVPTDVIVKARNTAADQRVAEKYGEPISKAMWHREGSFNGRTIPDATLTLMQAVGRGVRTSTDHALLAVLDPRLITKAYGKKILAALPPATRINDLPAAKQYLSELDEI